MTCDSCKTHGNIVTFAAQIWNTDVINAARQFSALGFVTETEIARSSGIEHRAYVKTCAAEEFWAEAETQLWNHDNAILTDKIAEIGLSSEILTPSPLVGVAHPEQVIKLCEAFGIAPSKNWRKGSPFLVFKFTDLPNRITGFLVTQYNDEFQPRRAFLSIFATRRQRRAEAGYYMLDNAFAPNPLFKDCTFIVDDLFWALRAQIVQRRYGLPPLPICVSFHNDDVTSTGQNWLALPHTTRIFYGQNSLPENISQACLGRGYVCFPVKEKYARESLPNRSKMHLKRMREGLLPWKQALYETVKTATSLDARGVAHRLSIPHDKLRAFCDEKKIAPHIREQLLTETLAIPTRQPLVAKYIIEKDGNWFSQSGRHVCAGILRVTHIFQNDNGDKTYKGFAVINDQRIDFIEDGKILAKIGLLEYIFRKAGAIGIFFFYDAYWNTKSLTLAMQLEPPKLVPVVNKIGWCADTNEFRFHNYSITNNGSVVPHEIVQPNPTIFPEPTVVAPLSIRSLLTPAHEHAACWAGIAAVISNIVAPISRLNYVATAVVGDAYLDLLQQIGQPLACPYLKQLSLTSVVNVATKIDWPHIIDAPYDRKRLMTTIVRHQQSPIVLKTLPETAIAATSYGWNGLRADIEQRREDLSFLSYLLPTYIQHVLKNRMTIATSKNFLAGVLRNLHGWLEDTYGATFNLKAAENYLLTPENAPQLIMAFVASEIEKGHIDLLPRPRRPDQDKNYILQNKNYWWINERIINKRFTTICGLTPDWNFVRKLLDTEQVFLGQNTIHNVPGFNVKADWASSFVFRENQKIG